MHRLALLSLLPLLTLVGCSANPVSGRPELMLYSDEEEAELGSKSDLELKLEFGELQSKELTAYVKRIGEKLAKVSDRPKLKFTFRILDDDIVNAFALPGGFVYLTRGVLPYLDSEEALAGVLGHEIGHVTARHTLKEASRQKFVGLLGAVDLLLPKIVSKGLTALMSPARLLISTKFSRGDEHESDELGLKYAHAAGYDPRGLASFLSRMDALEKLEDENAEDENAIPDWLSSHPVSADRVKEILDRCKSDYPDANKRASSAKARAKFLHRLDGLVFGPDPRQGFKDRGFFVHPQLKIKFPAPLGWTHSPGPNQAYFAAPSGKAFIFVAWTKLPTLAAAVKRIKALPDYKVTATKKLRIQSWRAVQLEADFKLSEREVKIFSTFVRIRKKVYGFHGVATPDQFVHLEQGFKDLPKGLHRVKRSEVLGTRPVRLRIVEAERTATFAELAEKYPIPGYAAIDLGELAVINGVKLETKIPKGRLLKVLTR